MSSSQAELTFPGDGEMARLMRAYPWAGSPLGDPAGWPGSLLAAVRICLTSPFPMIVWWGEPMFMFYNDAYLPLMGRKHPGLMRPGEQVWEEIWPVVGPMLDSVLRTGQAAWSQDLLLPMDRHGYWEETYWTCSHSPLHDDDGTVRGVFTAVGDTTEQVISRGRLGPSRLPTGFAVRYQPATRPLEAGGDWYDIVELPDGRIGIMVGDCAGHDLGAATVPGQLRSACRALLLQDASAEAALTAMDRFASFVPGGERATVFCGVLDPGTGELRYSSAGHPPGIVIHPGGQADLLDGARSLPLAIRTDAGRTEASYVLPSRSTLLFYTDGLVERRGRTITDGIAAAAAAVREGSGTGPDSLEDLAERLMTSLAPAGGYEDDVALVLYHHPAPLDVSFSAGSEQLASVRAQLRGWLRSCDVGARMAQDVLIAAGEAIANAIEHGHRFRPGEQVRLRAVSTANQLRVTITDRGGWRAAPPGDRSLRGHGIALMRALMQQVTIEPGPSGTTVDLYLRIGRGRLA